MKYLRGPWFAAAAGMWLRWPFRLCCLVVFSLLYSGSSCAEGFAGFTRISNVSSFRNPALLAEGITQFLNERSAAFNPQQDLNSNSIPSVAGADTIYAVVGSPATITCSGYDRVKLNTTGNISDVYSLRWFKDQRSTDFILFTYLDLPPHRIQMPQNEWKDRNISFSIQNQPQVRLPNVTFNDQATYICDLTPASRNTPVISEVSLKVVACPETVDLVIINSTASPSVSENRGNAINTTTTGIPSATQSFMRGTRILVRCSASSLPESKLSLSIPGLGLNNPESQNLNKTVASNGFVRGTLEGWFTLDATEDLIRANGLTVDCKAMVNNGTCASTNSLAIQLILPVTKSLGSSATALTNTDAGTLVSTGLTNAQIAGIVIGCLVALVLIAGLLYLALRQSNKGAAKIDPSPSQTPT